LLGIGAHDPAPLGNPYNKNKKEEDLDRKLLTSPPDFEK
jgi:hypothetical protein